MTEEALQRIGPDLAFALRELAWLRDEELPLLAARWLTEGFDGPTLRDLAGLTGGEIQMLDESLWRGALSDAGVAADQVRVRRTAAPFLARAVLAGKLSERRLCRLLWPEHLPDGSAEEPDMEALVYQWDDLLDYRDRLAGQREPRRRDSAELDHLDRRGRRAVQALAEGDIDKALTALSK